MFTLTPIPNAEAAVIKLLKTLGLNISHEDVIAELDKHPDYPSLLAVSDVLTAFDVEKSVFWPIIRIRAKSSVIAVNGIEYNKIDKQKAWCQMAEVTAMPTLLLNGYRLPQLYQLPDLKYMLG